MKKLFFITACLLALGSTPAMAQTGAADIIVVKVSESYGNLGFDISRAGSKPEHREFNMKQLKEKGEHLGGQAEYTRSLLVELAQQGYTLTSTYGSISGLTTLVFTKRQ